MPKEMVFLAFVVLAGGVFWFLSSPTGEHLASMAQNSASPKSETRLPRRIDTVPSVPLFDITPANKQEARAAYRSARTARTNARDERERLLSERPTGAEFVQSGRTMRMMPDLYALPDQDDVETTVAKTLLYKEAGFVYFAVPKDQPVPAGALPVVYEPQRKQLAVLTGMLTVTVNGDDAAPVARAMGMAPYQSFAHLKTHFFKSPALTAESLLSLLEKARAAPGVKEARLDVLVGRMQAQ